VIIDLGIKRDGLVPPSDLQELSKEERAELKVDEEVMVSVVSTHDQESLLVSLYKARVIEDWEKAEAFKQSGEVFEVEIEGYNKGGLICPFGRLRGFIPLSHMTGFSRGLDERERQRRMAKLRGDMIAIKIIEVDSDRQRLVFSQREGQKEWDSERKLEFIQSLTPGEVLHGRVRSLQDFGAFIDLGPADGLVHISELAWYRVAHPRDVVKVGEEIDVQVMRVDPERLRISLTRKPLLTNPWSAAEDKYQIGQLVEGRIVRITDYGAFVQLEPGIEGLLHASQLARMPVQNPREIVADGETHLLRVISVQAKRQRIGLSLKQVSYQEQIDWMTQQAAQQESAEVAEVEEDVVVTETVTEETTVIAETAEDGDTVVAEIDTVEVDTVVVDVASDGDVIIAEDDVIDTHAAAIEVKPDGETITVETDTETEHIVIDEVTPDGEMIHEEIDIVIDHTVTTDLKADGEVIVEEIDTVSEHVSITDTMPDGETIIEEIDTVEVHDVIADSLADGETVVEEIDTVSEHVAVADTLPDGETIVEEIDTVEVHDVIADSLADGETVIEEIDADAEHIVIADILPDGEVVMEEITVAEEHITDIVLDAEGEIEAIEEIDAAVVEDTIIEELSDED
jgi:small subunit ribosomal protein S1